MYGLVRLQQSTFVIRLSLFLCWGNYIYIFVEEALGRNGVLGPLGPLQSFCDSVILLSSCFMHQFSRREIYGQNAFGVTCSLSTPTLFYQSSLAHHRRHIFFRIFFRIPALSLRGFCEGCFDTCRHLIRGPIRISDISKQCRRWTWCDNIPRDIDPCVLICQQLPYSEDILLNQILNISTLDTFESITGVCYTINQAALFGVCSPFLWVVFVFRRRSTSKVQGICCEVLAWKSSMRKVEHTLGSEAQPFFNDRPHRRHAGTRSNTNDRRVDRRGQVYQTPLDLNIQLGSCVRCISACTVKVRNPAEPGFSVDK